MTLPLFFCLSNVGGILPRQSTAWHVCGNTRRSHQTSVSLSVPPSANNANIHQHILSAASRGDVASLSRASRVLKVPISEITDANGATSLHLAAACASEDAIAALFEIARGVGGVVPEYGHKEKVAHAFVQIQDANGATALHYAARSSLNVVDRLLRFGALVDAVDNAGKTALDYAMEAGNMGIVQRLRDDANF